MEIDEKSSLPTQGRLEANASKTIEAPHHKNL